MSCRRVWLFRNRTRDPGATVNSLGVTIPLLEIVIVLGFGVGEGDPGGSLSPHDRSTRRVAGKNSRTPGTISGF
jgi:hypothetical protein